MEMIKNRGNCVNQWNKQLNETPLPTVLAGILAVSSTVSSRDVARYLRMLPKMAQECVNGAIRDEFGWEAILSICCLLCKRIPEFGSDGVSGDFCDFALWLIDEAFHHPERSPDFETICGLCEVLLLELCSVFGKGTFFDSAMVGGKVDNGGKRRSRGISALCADIDVYEVTEEIEPIPAGHADDDSVKPAGQPVPTVSPKPVEITKRSSKKLPAGNRVKKERQIHTGFSDSEDETPARSRKRRVIRYQPESETPAGDGEGSVSEKGVTEGSRSVGDQSVGDRSVDDESVDETIDKSMDKPIDDTSIDKSIDKSIHKPSHPSSAVTGDNKTVDTKTADETSARTADETARAGDKEDNSPTDNTPTGNTPTDNTPTHETPVTPTVINDDSDWTDSDWSPAPIQSPRDSWSDTSSPRVIHETPEKAATFLQQTFSPRDPMTTATLPRFRNETPMPGSRLWWLLRCVLECRNGDVFRRFQVLRALRNASSAEIVQELVMAEIAGFVVSQELTEEARKLVEECVNETSEVAIRSALDETLARLREFHPTDAAGVSLMTQMIWLHLVGYRHLPENWLFNALTEIALLLFPLTNKPLSAGVSLTETALSGYLEILAVLTPEHKPVFLAGTRLNVFLSVSPQLGSLTTQGLTLLLKVCGETCVEGALLVGVRTCLKIDAIPRCDRAAVCDFLRRVAKSRTEEMKVVVEELTEDEKKRVRTLLSSGTKKKVAKSIEFGFSDWCGVCWDEMVFIVNQQ